MADDQVKAGSFDDADFTEGGYFDDKDATIVEARVVAFDYQGQRDPVCALGVTFKPDDAESDDDNRTEYYRIGDMSKFTPSPDGLRYIPVGSTGGMNKNAKAALFLRQLKDKGFPLSSLNGPKGISALDGLHVHVNIVPMPDIKTKDGAEKKDLKILVVTRIYDTPAAGAAAPAKSTAKRPGKKSDAPAETKTANTAAPAAAPAADEEVETTLSNLILGLLAEKDGKINKQLIPGAVFKGVSDVGLRGKCMALAANAAWLGSTDRPWQYEGGELTLG